MTQKTIKTASLGFSRIGANRELKFALEKFWQEKITKDELDAVGKEIRKTNWSLQSKFDYIPSGDFSYYDHVLDLSFEFSNIPAKFNKITDDFTRYFAVARGYQKDGNDFHACELSKWFNTNYHYILPEFHSDVKLEYKGKKFVNHFIEAHKLGHKTRPVIIGPVSYLLLGKEKTATREQKAQELLTCYANLFADLKKAGCEDVQIDEPFLATDLSQQVKDWYKNLYHNLETYGLKLHITTYFDEVAENTELLLSLPCESVHFDISEFSLPKLPKTEKTISVGIVNGRNIWKNNLGDSIQILRNLSKDYNIIVSTSCSLLHVPFSLDLETKLDKKIKDRLAFAKEKLDEIIDLKDGLTLNKELKNPVITIEKNHNIWNALLKLDGKYDRKSPFSKRKEVQKALGIPLFPTTTIGSFPQDEAIRKNRADFKKGLKNLEQYEDFCRNVIKDCLKRQEDLEIDVLVHGECERNDMVEYFGENLDGFCFTQNGWVQSYGSRCVKPPVIYGDVERKNPITVRWSQFAQSCTKKHVKGMLTGPVTILKWSFVRNDISYQTVCKQIALALEGEVLDLEKAGIKIIQIDEPTIREVLPTRKSKWNETLSWAIDCFKISCKSVLDDTQIHTHVCYSEFNDILEHILRLDADVLSIEASRSDLEVLTSLKEKGYENDIGPGVWDIHSPRVPSIEEIDIIIKKSIEVLKPEQIWINPDCGLKTRKWEETTKSLENLVSVSKKYKAIYSLSS